MLQLLKKVSSSECPFLKNRWIFHHLICHYEYDVIILGGGIIGTAIAKVIKENLARASVALLEKEQDLAQHQSSHNSNIIHSGIYYDSNSLKAGLCVNGAKLIYEYCETKNIPVKKCGKLIVASNILETYRLKKLYKLGVQNEVPGLLMLTNWKDVNDIQPNCRGLEALWCPVTGNVNWKSVAKQFARDFENEKGEIFLNCEVTEIKNSTTPSYPVLLVEKTGSKIFLAKYLITCLGLHSGTLSELEDSTDYKNISLHVNYRLLNPKLSRFIKTNIYAMPHIEMPFIGMHLSPMLDGSVLLGPNAVPALKLDDYQGYQIDLDYVRNNLLSQEFRLLFLKNSISCLDQVMQRIDRDYELKLLSNYFPMLAKTDIFPGPKAVQAQLVTKEGDFVDDFLIENFKGSGFRKRIINCKFIPSPGATSSLAIAHMVTEEIARVYC